MKERAKPIIFALLAWFCFALAVGASGKFHYASAVGVAATVWTLTALALAACWKIRTIRDCLTHIDVRELIAVHLTRFVGIYLLILGNRGDLPEGFAKPAGIGDIVIAIAAGFFVLVPQLRSRKVLLIWNALGLLDIIFVAFSALRFGLKDWQSIAPLRALPLSLLPTFIVPLVIVSHILIFVRFKTRVQN